MVKVLDREAINRMVSRKGSGGVGGGGGGGGSDIDLSSYATKSWTDDNYVGKEFFSSLFKAYDANGNEVLPNDTETTIDNIKAMFGFWTEFYISALGNGGQQSVDLRLAQLADVNVAGVTNGQVLTYDSTTQKWIATTIQSGTDMTTVWVNLANNGNQQINYSHLSGAVSLNNGTITIGSSSITPITSSAISDMATKTWTEQNYVGKEFFSSLFKAYDASGNEVLPNDTDTVIDNIKAMFGFWTEFYISALGNGGQQSVDLRLAQLADVNVAGVTNGQVLTYDSTTQKWIATTIQSGTDMTTVWVNLANNGNQQINASHLTTALADYYNSTTSRTANYVLAAPNGSAGAATFRALVAADIPNLSASKITSGTLPIVRGGTGETSSFAAIENLGGLSLASRGSNIPDNTDLNTYTTAGKYYCANSTHASTMTNPPTTGSGFTLIVYVNYTTSRLIQKAFLSNYITRFRYTDDGGTTWSAWRSFAYTDSDISGNAATATALANSSLTIWGRPFDGTGNVSGDMTGVGSITMSDNIYLNNGKYINGKTTGGTNTEFIGVTTADNVRIGYGFRSMTDSTTYIYAGTGGMHLRTNGASTRLFINSSGDVGIGTTSPSYKLHVSGDIYATGGVTSLSDSRYKNVIGEIGLTVEQIAKMPAVKYTWKNGGENTHIGTLAQDWQEVLPEAVLKANDEKGTLSIQYGVAALVSSIITARKVVDHEKRIAELERENKELKMKLKEG